jgi:hypothetical protein
VEGWCENTGIESSELCFEADFTVLGYQVLTVETGGREDEETALVD